MKFRSAVHRSTVIIVILIASVFLGAALAAKRCAHVRVTAQFLWMSDKWRLFFRVLIDVVWIICLLFLFIAAKNSELFRKFFYRNSVNRNLTVFIHGHRCGTSRLEHH